MKYVIQNSTSVYSDCTFSHGAYCSLVFQGFSSVLVFFFSIMIVKIYDFLQKGTHRKVKSCNSY